MQYNEFGKFIRHKRKNWKPQISLNEFAINNGIETSVLSRIETQKQGISLERLAQIASGFSMNVSELVAEYEKYYIKLQKNKKE